MICQQGGHKSDACPELTKELKPGFYKPSGGGHQGGHDDDDEKIKMNSLLSMYRVKWVDTVSLTQEWNTSSGLVFNPQKIF